MESQQIMKTDILDIVFDKRNKAYGAYELRKHYPARLKKAVSFMFLLAMVFTVYSLWVKKNSPVRELVFDFAEIELKNANSVPVEPEKEKIQKEEIAKPELKNPVPANRKILASRVLIVDSKARADSIGIIEPNDVNNKTGGRNDVSGPVVLQTGISTTMTVKKKEPEVNRDQPLNSNAVDVLPAFPGGMDALQNFLKRNLENPYDLENGETIGVQIKFVVGYDGKLQHFEVQRDGGVLYNKEVIRVLKKMPEWIPGIFNGEKVSVYYSIPVKFVMSD